MTPVVMINSMMEVITSIVDTSPIASLVNIAIEEVRGNIERNFIHGVLISPDAIAIVVKTKPATNIIWTSIIAEASYSTLETVDPMAPFRKE